MSRPNEEEVLDETQPGWREPDPVEPNPGVELDGWFESDRADRIRAGLEGDDA